MPKKDYDNLVSITPGRDHILWGRDGETLLWADRCTACSGRGVVKTQPPPGVRRRGEPVNRPQLQLRHDCENCRGLGWHGIHPELPTIAPPGSAEKQVVLQVRYQFGIPIYNTQDVGQDAFNYEDFPVPYAWHSLRLGHYPENANAELEAVGSFDEDDE